MKPVVAVVLALVGSAAFADSICPPPFSGSGNSSADIREFNGRWFAWCQSIGGTWTNDGCLCSNPGQSGGGDSYDYAAEQRAAEWRRQQEELHRIREEQLQREALEHAQQMQKQLQDLDDRGASLGVQAQQLRERTQAVTDRETKTAVVAKELAPVVAPVQQAKTPPLSASQFFDPAKLQKKKEPIVVPSPVVVPEKKKTRVEALSALAFDKASAVFLSIDQTARLLGTWEEIKEAIADESGKRTEELVLEKLKKFAGDSSKLLDAYEETRKWQKFNADFRKVGLSVAASSLQSIEQAATEGESALSDVEARQRASAKEVEEFVQENTAADPKDAAFEWWFDS